MQISLELVLPVDRNGVQSPVIMWTSCGGGGYHMACRDTLMIFSLPAMLIFSGSDSYPERRGVRKGNTVYVYGSGLAEDSLRSAFCQHGNIIDLSMDNPRKYGANKQLCVHIVVISNNCYNCIIFLRTCILPCFLLLTFDSMFKLRFVFPVSISSCAFITFEKMESADQAVAEVGKISYKKILTMIHMIFLLQLPKHSNQQKQDSVNIHRCEFI